MGRRSFNEEEAREIRQLLREKGVADSSRQKTIRGRLRSFYSFWISDFSDESGGFTASDFDELVSRGTIQITLGDKTTPEESALPRPVKSIATPSNVQSHVLPDVLAPGLRVVFCGTAVGTTSAQRGVYYAGRGNQFWAVLARVGLTPRELSPTEFAELPRYGIGLTDLSKFAYGSDAEVAVREFDPDRFRSVIETCGPRFIAFNGKKAAEAFRGRSVAYGRQAESIGTTQIFVLPSTSGAARGYWDESYWSELAAAARARR